MRWKVVQDEICDKCRLEAVTTGHLFWTCLKAKEVWSCSKMVVLSSQARFQSFQDLLWDILFGDRVEEDKVAKTVIIA